jgi:peptide-methionine (S)-S-oxide reductase
MNMQKENVNTQNAQIEIATLAGGCFWCLEPLFDALKGVTSVESGYTGGETVSPNYKDVCKGNTGHAEVVRVSFDPEVVSYRDLLEVFFSSHDPTTLNRQGNDVGTQYRSAIFYHSPQQKAIAEETIRDLTSTKIWERSIVTEVTPAQEFYVAEDYHQNYFQQNGAQPYCQLVVAPKVAKLRKTFLEKLKG